MFVVLNVLNVCVDIKDEYINKAPELYTLALKESCKSAKQ